MEAIYLLPLALIPLIILIAIILKRQWISPAITALGLASFPLIFWKIRSVGPFFGGADIGAGLVLIGSSIFLSPFVIFIFFKSRDWSLKKALKFSSFCVLFYVSLSVANHFLLIKQNKDYKKKSLLDCKLLPFHCAVRDNKREVLKELKSRGENIESKDGWGRTAMAYAFYSSNKNDYILELLLLGANPHTVDSSAYPLFWNFLFTEPKNFKLAQQFLDHGFDINILYGTGKKLTLLNDAIVRKDFTLIDYLLEKNANISLKDGYGYNACERVKLHVVTGSNKLNKLCGFN